MATRAGTETILTAPRRNRHAAHEVMRHGRSHVGRVIRGAMATRTARDPTTTAWAGQVSGLGRAANHALEQHVVDLPPLPGPVESVLDRNLLLPHGHDLGPHGRVVAVDRLADEEDLLARPVLDLRQVRPLEQIGEEPDELLALLRRALA